MDMSGEVGILATRDKVWAALNDAEVLKACISGAETVEKISDTEFSAIVIVKVGPVKAKFKGKVTLSEIDPPNGYTITGEGKGGPAGFGKGGATVKLTEDGNATILSYTAHASVGGKLAQIGSRLVDSVANKMANDFFTAFSEHVGDQDQEVVGDTSIREKKSGKLPSWLWAVGLIPLIAALIWQFYGK